MFKEILDYIKISLKEIIWDGVDCINPLKLVLKK